MSISVRHALMVSALIGSVGLWAVPVWAQNTDIPAEVSRENQARAAMLRDLREKIELLEKERSRLKTSPLINTDTMTLPTQSYEEGSKLRYLERKIRTLEEENATLKSQAPLDEQQNSASDDTTEATVGLVKKYEAQAALLSDENDILKKKLASLDPDFAKVYKPDSDKKIEDVLDTLFNEDGTPKPPPPPLPGADKDKKVDEKIADPIKEADKKNPDKKDAPADKAPLSDIDKDIAADLKKAEDKEVTKTETAPAPVPAPKPSPAPKEEPKEKLPAPVSETQLPVPQTPAVPVVAPVAAPSLAPHQPAPVIVHEELPPAESTPTPTSAPAPAPVARQNDIEIAPFDPAMIKHDPAPVAAAPKSSSAPVAPSVEIAPFDPDLVTKKPPVVTPSPEIDIAPFDPKLIAKKSGESRKSAPSTPRLEIAPFDPSMIKNAPASAVDEKTASAAPVGEPVKLAPSIYNQ